MNTPTGAAALCLAIVAAGCGGAPVEPAAAPESEPAAPAEPDPQEAHAPRPSGSPDVIRQLSLSSRYGCGVMADGGAVDLVVGARDACALTGDGEVLCWGAHRVTSARCPEDDDRPRCSLPDDTGPAAIPDVEGIERMRMNPYHPIVWLDDADGLAYRVDLGMHVPQVEPVAPDERAKQERKIGDCWRDSDGRVVCDTLNESGENGDGTFRTRRGPAPVPGLQDVRAVAAGQGFTCAIRADRRVTCWGRNHSFQLGTPEPDPAVPSAVQAHLFGRAASH